MENDSLEQNEKKLSEMEERFSALEKILKADSRAEENTETEDVVKVIEEAEERKKASIAEKYKDLERFKTKLQKHFEQRGKTPFLLIPMYLDDESGEQPDFDFMLENIAESLNTSDDMYVDQKNKRIILFLDNKRREDFQGYYATLKNKIEEQAPAQVDSIIKNMKGTVAPNGNPFETVEEFLEYTLKEMGGGGTVSETEEENLGDGREETEEEDRYREWDPEKEAEENESQTDETSSPKTEQTETDSELEQKENSTNWEDKAREAIDKYNDELKKVEEELENISLLETEKRNPLLKKQEVLEKHLAALEGALDRKQKPFAYYLAEKVSNPHVRKFIERFGEINLSWENKIEGHDQTDSFHIWLQKYLRMTGENEGFFEWSDSGFVLIIKNVDELRKEENGREFIDNDSSDAIYALEGPDGEIIENNIKGYENAKEIFLRKISEHQDEMYDQFIKEGRPESFTEIPTEIQKTETENTTKENIDDKKTEKGIDDGEEVSDAKILGEHEGSEDLKEAREKYFKARQEFERLGKKEKGATRDIKEKKYKASKAVYEKLRAEKISELIADGSLEKALGFLENEDKEALKMEGDLWRLLSKGVDAWDNWGEKEEGWKGITKRITKKTASLFMIGAATLASVDKIGNAAQVLHAGSNTYLGRKLLFGVGFGAIMEWSQKLSPKKKRALTLGMTGVSAALALSGGWIGGIGLAGAAGFGYGISNITKKYDKKIKASREEIVNNITIENILENLPKIEDDLRKIRKLAEKTRVLGKLAEATVAVTASVGILEMPTISHGIVHGIDGLFHNGDEIQTPEIINPEIPGPVASHQTEPIPDADPDATPATPDAVEPHPVIEDAIIGKGEGIEHAFIRQLEGNPELLEKLGYEVPDDSKALHQLAGKVAHILAIDHGYVDPTGHEVWVAEADKVAYELRVDGDQIVVDERSAETGEVFETHDQNAKFEMGEREKIDDYEMKHTQETTQAVEDLEQKILHDMEAKEAINYDPTRFPGEEAYIGDHLGGNENQQEVPLEQRTEYEDTSKESRTEYEDTSNTPDNTTASGELNPDRLPVEILSKIQENYNENISKLFAGEKNYFEYVNMSAVTASETPIDDGILNELKPFLSFIQELEKLTGIHPREGSSFFGGERMDETTSEYITRVSRIEAANGHLLSVNVDNDGISHIERKAL